MGKRLFEELAGLLCPATLEDKDAIHEEYEEKVGPEGKHGCFLAILLKHQGVQEVVQPFVTA
jgi:hypothetical protein